MIFLVSYSYGIDYYYTSQYPYLNFLKWSYPTYLNQIGPLKNNIKIDALPLTELHSIQHDIHFQLFGNLNFSISEAPLQQISGLTLIEFSNKISFQNNFTFLSNSSDNKHFKGKVIDSLDGWSGYLHSSLLNYKYTNGHLLFGKTNIFLNSFSDNLLLNGENPANSAIWWQHNSEKWKYDWAIQFLDDINSYGRFFTFHRYTLSGSTYSFSFSEFSIIKYIDFFRDGLPYILPSGMITEVEINDGGSNLFWFFDGYSQLGMFTFFGEFLIDDFALDKKSPNKLAFKVGNRLSVGENEIQLEYLRINRWVGNYYYPELQMHENKVLIGHPLGPDIHKLSLELYSKYSDKNIINLELYAIEKGEGSIDEPWPVELASSNFGYSNEDFPSGEKNLYQGFTINQYFLIGKSLTFNSIINYEINTGKIDLDMKINLIY